MSAAQVDASCRLGAAADPVVLPPHRGHDDPRVERRTTLCQRISRRPASHRGRRRQIAASKATSTRRFGSTALCVIFCLGIHQLNRQQRCQCTNEFRRPGSWRGWKACGRQQRCGRRRYRTRAETSRSRCWRQTPACRLLLHQITISLSMYAFRYVCPKAEPQEQCFTVYGP